MLNINQKKNMKLEQNDVSRTLELFPQVSHHDMLQNHFFILTLYEKIMI